MKRRGRGITPSDLEIRWNGTNRTRGAWEERRSVYFPEFISLPNSVLSFVTMDAVPDIDLIRGNCFP